MKTGKCNDCIHAKECPDSLGIVIVCQTYEKEKSEKESKSESKSDTQNDLFE